MAELKTIPEQDPMNSYWEISKEFCDLIDRLPFYSGVLLEDGESVNLGFMRSSGFNPIIPLDTYIKGSVYAVLKEKCANTYVPKGLELKVKEKMEALVREEFSIFNPVAYSCSSKDQLKRLQEEDACK